MNGYKIFSVMASGTITRVPGDRHHDLNLRTPAMQDPPKSNTEEQPKLEREQGSEKEAADGKK